MADKEKEMQGMEEEEEVITLVDEEGKEADFYELATVDYKDKWYIILEPAEPIEGFEEGEVLIYELGEDEKGEETFLPVDDEETLQGVFDEFEKLLDEEEADEE